MWSVEEAAQGFTHHGDGQVLPLASISLPRNEILDWVISSIEICFQNLSSPYPSASPWAKWGA